MNNNKVLTAYITNAFSRCRSCIVLQLCEPTLRIIRKMDWSLLSTTLTRPQAPQAPRGMAGRSPQLQCDLSNHLLFWPEYLHQCHPVLISAQRRRAPQRASRASRHRRGAGDAHLSLRYVSKRSLLLHINQHYGPLQT